MPQNQSDQLLLQAQQFQQQMHGIVLQKEGLGMQMMEISNALEELEKAPQGDVYKMAGPLLIKSGKEEIRKDLQEKRELIDLKIKTLEKSEQKIRLRIDELRERLTKGQAG